MADNSGNSGSVSIIPDALRYYDQNTERFLKLRRMIRYIKNVTAAAGDTYGTDHIVISFYDENKKVLFTTRIEMIGSHHKAEQIWVWGWAVPVINKAMTTIIRDVFIYGTDINVSTNGIFDEQKILLKNELLSSRSIVTDIIQVETHCALASYLTKQEMVLPISNLSDNEYVPYYDYYSSTSLELVSGLGALNLPEDNTAVTYYMFILDIPDLNKFGL